MAKDKKSKKQSGKKSSSAGGGIKGLAQNPLVADVVAAALVATASALKDSRRARALASDVADELGALSGKGLDRGNAMWELALTIGKRSLDALSGELAPNEASTKSAKTKPAKTKPAAKTATKSAAGGGATPKNDGANKKKKPAK